MSMRIPWIRRSTLERVEENLVATDKMRNYEEVAQFTLDTEDCDGSLRRKPNARLSGGCATDGRLAW